MGALLRREGLIFFQFGLPWRHRVERGTSSRLSAHFAKALSQSSARASAAQRSQKSARRIRCARLTGKLQRSPADSNANSHAKIAWSGSSHAGTSTASAQPASTLCPCHPTEEEALNSRKPDPSVASHHGTEKEIQKLQAKAEKS